MKTKPYPYQREGYAKIAQFGGRALIADEMGLGKTFQALLYARRNPELRPILVICPASLKWNWKREALLHANIKAKVLESSTPPVHFQHLLQCPMLIINFDILEGWMKVLGKYKPQLVIIDEGQKIINPKAKRTRHCVKIGKRTPQVLVLSGTPFRKYPAQMFPVLNMLRSDLFPSFIPFAWEYCGPKKKPWGMEYKGCTNRKKLNRLLKSEVMIRRLKKHVMKDLPPLVRQVIPLPLSKPKEYLEAYNSFVRWIIANYKKKAKKALRAEALVKRGYLKRLIGKLKLKAVKEWIDDFLENTNEKLLVFGVHKKILRPLFRRYQDMAVMVDGSVKGRDRQNAFDQFNKKAQTRLFFGNLQAAGEGWSCTSASHLAFVELGWTPVEHTQAEARIHGIKRGKSGTRSNIYYLLAANTIEEAILKIIQERQENLSAVLDGEGEGEILDVFDQLCSLIRTKGMSHGRAKKHHSRQRALQTS